MKASIKRTVSLMGSVAFLVAAMMIYSLFIRPEYKLINELRGMFIAKSNLLAEQQSIISQVQNLLAQYQGSASIQQAVSLALPTKEEAAGIFSQLQALAQANDLTIEVFGVQNQPTKSVNNSRGVTNVVKDLGVVQTLLKISGSYNDFKNFLQGVETNIRVMDLVSLKMDKVNHANASFFIYNLVLNTYYQTD